MASTDLRKFNFYPEYIWQAADFDNYQTWQMGIFEGVFDGAFGAAVLKGLRPSGGGGMTLLVDSGVGVNTDGRIVVVGSQLNTTVASPSGNPARTLAVLRPKLTAMTTIPEPVNPSNPVPLHEKIDYDLIVLNGTPAGSPVYPSTQSGDIIVCGLKLNNGHTTITEADLDWGVVDRPRKRKARVLNISSSYTVLSTDEVVEANFSGASGVVTMPSAGTVEGQVFKVVKVDSSSNNVLVVGNISGATGTTISQQWKALDLYSNGISYVDLNKTVQSGVTDVDVLVTANSLNESLYTAIVNGDLGGDLKVVVVSGTSFTVQPGNRYYLTNASLTTGTLDTTGFTQGKRFGIVSTSTNTAGWAVIGSTGSHQFVADTRTSFVGVTAEMDGSSGTCVECDATTANGIFEVVNSQGSFTLSNYQYQGNTYSYFMGGGFFSSVVDRLTYSGEGIAATSAALTVAKLRGGHGHSTLKGFDLGGRSSGGVIGTNDAITFSGEAIAALSHNMGTARQMQGGGSINTKTYSIAGDTALATGSPISSIEALAHTGETFTTLGATSSSARSICDSSGQSLLKIYCMGGHTGTWGGAGAVSTIDAFVFIGETCGSIGSTLSVAKVGGSGTCSTTAAYIGGASTDGNSAGEVSTIEKLLFSGEVRTTLAAVMTTVCQAGSGSPSTLKGYATLGLSSGSDSNVVNALVFSGETNTALSNTLTSSRGGSAGVQI